MQHKYINAHWRHDPIENKLILLFSYGIFWILTSLCIGRKTLRSKSRRKKLIKTKPWSINIPIKTIATNGKKHFAVCLLRKPKKTWRKFCYSKRKYGNWIHLIMHTLSWDYKNIYMSIWKLLQVKKSTWCSNSPTQPVYRREITNFLFA